MAERELLVRIVGDDKDLQRALTSTDRRLQSLDNRTASFGRNIKTAFAAAGISVGASLVIAEVQKSVAAASDLNEQLARINVILGESAQETIDWSKTTATSFGISQRAALAASATFAGLFQTVGVAQQEAGALSRTLVELAADLASLQNTSTAEALQALRSGLAGEAEPLRRFNIFLTEARVQEEALAASGKTAASSLTAQEKALARYNLILRDSAPAQGNFSDTSKELANQQRILAAQIDDLETQLGQVLIPTLTDVVTSLNSAVTAAQDLQAAFKALQDIGGIDIPINMPVSIIFTQGRGKDLRGGLADLGENIRETVESAFSAGIDPFKGLADRAQGKQRGFQFFPSTPEGADPAEQTKDEADKQEKDTKSIVDDAKRIKQAQARQRKEFAELGKGLGLKLDRARLTTALDDDIAALRELERAIQRQIGREGRTFKLVQQLTDTRLQIMSLVEQQAREAEEAAEAAFQATMDALDLDFEVAQSTKSLKDDEAALRAIEKAILGRIAQEGRSTELLRQLFQVRQKQADVAKQLVEQRRERLKQKQFEALGLTEEGDRPTPSSGALLRRARSLQDEIKGTALDTPKTREQLQRIIATLKANFKTAGKDVRDAILDMLNEISGAFDDKSGPLTRTSGLNTKKVLEGLGLSDEEIAELRGRLSSFNSAGRGLAPALQPSTRTTGGGALDRRGDRPIVVESHTTINLDGQQVASVVTKQQQKDRRRNPPQKRGPNRGRI